MPAQLRNPKEMTPRRQRNHERMVATILDTARQIMREDGVAALSMQELARRLDMRAPSLYNYFTGKMDIYDALFRLGFERYSQHVAQAAQPAQSWQEEIRLAIEANMSFALQNPELYQLCFERPVPGFVPSAESMQASLDVLKQSYARGAQLLSGIHSGLSPEQAIDLVIAIMHGLTAQHLANEPHRPVGQGRFGSLIPQVVNILDKAWSNPQ
jgi:AcrR family transcriptional regulator